MSVGLHFFAPNHIAIQTQHVYADDKQVFLKKLASEADENGTNFVEWFPTNFQWQPLAVYPPPLDKSEDF